MGGGGEGGREGWKEGERRKMDIYVHVQTYHGYMTAQACKRERGEKNRVRVNVRERRKDTCTCANLFFQQLF